MMTAFRNKRKVKWVFMSVMIIAAMYSCDKDNNDPGYVYYPEMKYSRAYESYSENPVYKDKKTLHEPVEGTVPRGYYPLPYTKSIDDRVKAGEELNNPVEISPTGLERGKVLYNRFCNQCHGSLGDGKGHLYTSKVYPFPPASLVNEKVTNLPDGAIFHSITYGFGVMGEHGSIIDPEERWQIVNYIREELQGSN